MLQVRYTDGKKPLLPGKYHVVVDRIKNLPNGDSIAYVTVLEPKTN